MTRQSRRSPITARSLLPTSLLRRWWKRGDPNQILDDCRAYFAPHKVAAVFKFVGAARHRGGWKAGANLRIMFWWQLGYRPVDRTIEQPELAVWTRTKSNGKLSLLK
jgi:hypothetical protein